MATDTTEASDHEIDNVHFIQLDLSSLKGTALCTLTISSIQATEGANVYAAPMAGTLAGATSIPGSPLLGSAGPTVQSIDITAAVNAGDYIDVQATSGNVLIETVAAACVPINVSLSAPNPLPVCGSTGNQLTGPAGFTTYSWTLVNPSVGWAITGGADSQTVTYTAGPSGSAEFQLTVTDSNGCPGTGQVTFGCSAPPVGCRVTGGSNHQHNNSQGQCVLTTPPTFVSHSAQVGAPHAGATEFTPYSTCISGELQHNRHLTMNSLVGVLHASGNGSEHDFDSLLCACLPCDLSSGVVGELCNPGDRNCGPTPPAAPANKICFSGVGDYTDTTGQKTVKAVFRVDIEDRGQGQLPDRYRIRIWLLGTDCRPFGPDSTDGLALRFYVSADAALIGSVTTTEDLRNPTGAGAPDIDDGGDLTQGEEQIHPQTGSTCP
jgi:hypothetical protein